jgi:hypothetical protein
MKRDTTKLAGDVADAKLFGDWFDLIETDRRTEVRGFIEPTIAEALGRSRCLLLWAGHCSGIAARGQLNSIRHRFLIQFRCDNEFHVLGFN